MRDARRPVRKVLMTADTIGGVWPYALDLAAELAREGVFVCLATMGPPPTPLQRAHAVRNRGLELFESTYRVEWMDDPWDDVARAGDWLLSIADRVRPDVVHVNGYAHASLPFSAPKVIVAHSCVLSWHRAVLGARPPESFDRYRREVARGLESADAVVAATRTMLDALGDYGASVRLARVISHGTDSMRLQPVSKEPLIFSTGPIWDRAKNLRVLSEVAPKLSWPTFVAGAHPHASGTPVRLDGLCEVGSLDRSHSAEWMSRASIYALPARYEPFGLAVLEAALAGCALVLGDVPSLREIWGDAALFVPPDDARELEAALRKLIDDPALRSVMSQCARTRASSHTRRRMGSEYLDLYQHLTSHAFSHAREPVALRA
jgi:glycosyltransferase involved in cell wall biosynthesis